MTLGVHFALSDSDYARIIATDDPEALVELIQEDIEERYLDAPEASFQSDKAWDAIHRCLTDGSLLYETGPFPLALAVLGGRALDAGDDYTACLVEKGEVRAVAKALRSVSRSWFEERFATLGTTDYAGPGDEEDLEYTWSRFQGLREFFSTAAGAGRPVLFTTDA
jgi:hypothetical protein